MSRIEKQRKLLVQKMPKHSICAEIGVWKGAFSNYILNINKPKLLYLIDPWKYMPKYKGRLYGGGSVGVRNQKGMNNIFSKVKSKFKKYSNVIILRSTSTACVNTFNDDYFDWLYIDGNHSYAFVKADLDNYINKVKIGGFITGDDYTWRGVKLAVQNFVKENASKVTFSLLANQFIIERRV